LEIIRESSEGKVNENDDGTDLEIPDKSSVLEM
jgi:hypothetical protein